ncbi:MAG: aldo/keto reductase [Thaumarchaeota archaeon]|nr:aldo/keto reductase [Nitrososphaerota archaeon]
MHKIPLGNSGLEVSEIGIGVWQASSEWGASDEEVVQAVEKSCELGVNLFDTAEGYGKGHSEIVLGRAIAKVGREKVMVATKVFSSHLRYEELQKACRASLTRLGIKQIDLYQIHWPDPWEQIPLKHTMKAMEKLYTEGKIRAIGVSNFAVRDLEEARSCLSKADIVSNQIRYNLLERQVEEEVLPYCKKNGITVLAWSPLGQGALTGKYGPRKLPSEPARANNPLFSKHNLLAANRLVKVLKKIANDHGKTVSQVALNWLARNPIVVPIPGARNATQADQNAHSVGWKMSADEAREVERACEEVKLDYFLR